jgi:hypothetical protein
MSLPALIDDLQSRLTRMIDTRHPAARTLACSVETGKVALGRCSAVQHTRFTLGSPIILHVSYFGFPKMGTHRSTWGLWFQSGGHISSGRPADSAMALCTM